MSMEVQPTGNFNEELRSQEEAGQETASQHYDLFEKGLKDNFGSENNEHKSIKNDKKASPEKLIQALEDMVKETQGRLTRLRQVFEVIGSESGKYKAIAGMLKEAEGIIEDPL